MDKKVLYFAYGDNLNAKNLYYHCKKINRGYPFVRAVAKAFLADHKIVINARGANHKFGMITVEQSIGHVVPGIVFEVYDVDNLKVFGEEFENVLVSNIATGELLSVLINKREAANVLELKKVKKAKLSKGRKKVFRKAIKWRNLDQFETCFESALSNYLYPHLVKNFFYQGIDFENVIIEPRLKEILSANEYNTEIKTFILPHSEEEIKGMLIRTTTLKLPMQLKALDNYHNSGQEEMKVNRRVMEIFDQESGESMFVWVY